MNEEYQNLLIIENKSEPEIPNYIKEKNTSFYTATVLSTIIVICAIVSLIVNIKRKSKVRITLSVILPIIAIITSQLLERVVLQNVIKNGTEASSIGVILPIVIGMIGILITLIAMIIKTKK